MVVVQLLVLGFAMYGLFSALADFLVWLDGSNKCPYCKDDTCMICGLPRSVCSANCPICRDKSSS